MDFLTGKSDSVTQRQEEVGVALADSPSCLENGDQVLPGNGIVPVVCVVVEQEEGGDIVGKLCLEELVLGVAGNFGANLPDVVLGSGASDRIKPLVVYNVHRLLLRLVGAVGG